MAQRRAKRTTKAKRTGRSAKQFLATQRVCSERPFCYAVEYEYDRKVVRVLSIELFEPNPNGAGGVWTEVRPPKISAKGVEAAAQALKDAAQDRTQGLECNPGCVCIPLGLPGPWTRWYRQPVTAEFSIAAPNPPPARLQYRVNGKVRARNRAQLGICLAVPMKDIS